MLEDRGEVNSLISAAVIFVIYLFVCIITYFVLSTPIDMIFDAFAGSDFGVAAADTARDTYIPLYRQALTIFFCIFISIPVTWFIFWCFKREPFVGNIRP